MSMKIFRLFSNSLKHSLPRLPLKTVVRYRALAAMEAVDVKTMEVDGKLPDKKYTRFKKRQWEDAKLKEIGETEEKREKFERIKKKKMAVLLGYCGVDYFGMQRNPGVSTIEEELLKAMHGANYITDADFLNQQNAQFQRSSRTDKGVSAARQVVSLKLPLEVDIEEINKRLPECIRVFGIRRVTNTFNSKLKCNGRTYSYTLPTYVFETSLETDDDRRKYRITPEKLEHVKDVLSIYKGTKCYHNFTEKKHFQDPSASRFMMGFTVDKVFVEKDLEFAVLLVKGQSFMIHQIRKMVGLMIAVVRGYTDQATLEKAFTKDKVMIPTAPGLGLVLDKVHYETYDNKFKDSHDSLTWDKEEESIQQFLHKFVYPVIVNGEVEGNSMGKWLEKLQRHSYEPSEDNVGNKEAEDAENGGGDDDDDDEVVESGNAIAVSNISTEKPVGSPKEENVSIDKPKEEEKESKESSQ